MSIWKNFKDADHSVEKNIFGAILSIALVVCLFFLIDKGSEKVPDIRRLFVDNGKYFRWFIFSAAGLFIFSYMTYIGSLDFWEAETKSTIKVATVSAFLWALFWIFWGIYCAWLTHTFDIQTTLVKLTLVVLVTLPGLIAFVFSRNIRKQQLKEEEDDKTTMGRDYYNSEPYILCVDRKYYSGYYGLLCLPVYLICLLIGNVF